MLAAASDERRSGGPDVRLRSGEGRAVVAATVLGSVLASMGLTAVATAGGPVLGGLLVDLVSWRAIFVAPLLFPVAAAFVTYTVVRETPPNPDRSVDTRGALFAFLTVSTFSFAVIRGPTGWLQAEVIVALAAAVVGASAFVRSQRSGTDPTLRLVLFRNRTFSGGNAVTLVSYVVSGKAFLFLVVQLQTTLGYRPARAGAALVPLYLIMLVGSPQSGRLADEITARPGRDRQSRCRRRHLVAEPRWAGSEFVADIVPGIVLLALGLATLGAPLTSATLSAVGEHDQGVASGVNNTVGQLAGLLMTVVLPAVAGLSGQTFDGPEFADGYQLAMRVCALLCLGAATIAGVTIRPGNVSTSDQPRRP